MFLSDISYCFYFRFTFKDDNVQQKESCLLLLLLKCRFEITSKITKLFDNYSFKEIKVNKRPKTIKLTNNKKQ